ncbi:Uncharacterised protein [Vibrio cholerae]|nr:Uncharacterised protein [Vibrio cholerae]
MLLPFEPVIAITGVSTCHAKSSISPTTGIPAASTCWISGVANAMPGLVTTKSALSNHSRFQPLRCSATSDESCSCPGGASRVSITCTVTDG